LAFQWFENERHCFLFCSPAVPSGLIYAGLCGTTHNSPLTTHQVSVRFGVRTYFGQTDSFTTLSLRYAVRRRSPPAAGRQPRRSFTLVRPSGCIGTWERTDTISFCFWQRGGLMYVRTFRCASTCERTDRNLCHHRSEQIACPEFVSGKNLLQVIPFRIW